MIFCSVEKSELGKEFINLNVCVDNTISFFQNIPGSAAAAILNDAIIHLNNVVESLEEIGFNVIEEETGNV